MVRTCTRDSLKRWSIPALGFAITAAIWPGLQGAATSPRWAIAALTLPWLHWSAFPFVAWLWLRLEFDPAVHWTILTAAFCCGFKTEDITPTIKAIGAAIALCSLVAIGQAYFDFGWIPQVATPGGLFLNKNLMGEMAALVFAAAFLVYVPWIALATLPSIALSGSRTAWLATGVTLFLNVSWRWRFVLSAFGCAFALWAWHTGFNTHTYTLGQRFMLWQDAVPRLTFFGNGTYEWANVENREPNMHNDWLQLVWELGIFGLIPIFAVLACRATAFAVAVIIIGSLSFPLEMPASGWLIAFVLGSCLRRDHFVSGVVLRPRLATQGL